jgi:hypothetical protein
VALVAAVVVRGRGIAEAFRDLPKPEREFLISRTSPEGWSQLFGPPTAGCSFRKGICGDVATR